MSVVDVSFSRKADRMKPGINDITEAIKLSKRQLVQLMNNDLGDAVCSQDDVPERKDSRDGYFRIEWILVCDDVSLMFRTMEGSVGRLRKSSYNTPREIGEIVKSLNEASCL